MVVGFCGHRTLGTEFNDVKGLIYDSINNLIVEGADRFLFSGYGSFEDLCIDAINELKNEYDHIRTGLIVPYKNRMLDRNKYDYIEHFNCDKVAFKDVITMKNEHMVDKADVLLTYLEVEVGDMEKVLSYAREKGKRIINLYNEESI